MSSVTPCTIRFARRAQGSPDNEALWVESLWDAHLPTQTFPLLVLINVEFLNISLLVPKSIASQLLPTLHLES